MIGAFLTAVFAAVAIAMICLCVVGGAVAAVDRLVIGDPPRDDLMAVADAVREEPVRWSDLDERQFRRWQEEHR